MIPPVRRRKGALLYLFCSCSLLVACFLTSYSRNDRPHSSWGLEVYPWQMIGYDEYDCGCPRSGPPIVSESEQSLCSDWSTSRGLGQKVVSYTLYGNASIQKIQKAFYEGVEDRLKEVEKYYKGFVVRLYHNLTLSNPDSKQFLCHLYCTYPHFDPCQIKHLYPEQKGSDMENWATSALQSVTSERNSKTDSRVTKEGKFKKPNRKGLPLKPLSPKEILAKLSRESESHSYESLLVGKMWRFLVMGDPLVSEFLVRDVDSYILEREVAAVEQWLFNSTALLHAMRDHPKHNGLILAGLWGGSRTRGGVLLSELLKKILRWPPLGLWDYDQIILKREVWPEVTDDVLVHDSYFCHNPNFQSKHRSEPFPTRRRESFFVGWGPTRDPNELEGIIACPHQCRPVNHQDWLLC